MRVLFPGGITTTALTVNMVNDVALEGDEKFRVSIDPLSLPFGVTLGNHTSAEVVILDDDGKR